MSQAVFLSGNLMRHVAVMSFTASIGILAIFAVDFVDMIFISMLGNSALAAAVGYAGTLLFFTNSINIGLSIAAGSLVSRALGADKAERAREYATSVAVAAAIIGLIVPLLLIPNLEAVFRLLGADGETLTFATRYASIILPTMVVMGVAMATMATLRAYGDARGSMMVTLFGGVVNAVLDPLLIFGLGLGLDGAAIASVLARLTMAAAGLYLAINRHHAFARPSFGMIGRDYAAVSAIALPAIMTNLASPVGNAIVTREMARFGTDAVAAMAVIGRLTPMAFAVLFALSGAIGPIIGQNFGAGATDRVKGAFTAGLKFLGAYVVIVAVLLFLLRAPIAALFEADGEMRTLIFLFCGPLALLQFFNGVIFVCNASFNNLGRPLLSTAVNWGRHTLGTLPFVLVGASMAGASGVLVGQAIGGVIFAAIGVALALRVMNAMAPESEVDAFTEQQNMHQHATRRNW